MKIKEIIWQSRRDFKAIYECEHCGDTYEGNGYDDANFHMNVISGWECKKCGEKSDSTYEPKTTKHAAWEEV